MELKVESLSGGKILGIFGKVVGFSFRVLSECEERMSPLYRFISVVEALH